MKNHGAYKQMKARVFTGRMPFLSPNQQCQSTEGKSITFHVLAYPKLTWEFSNLVFHHYRFLVTFGRGLSRLLLNQESQIDCEVNVNSCRLTSFRLENVNRRAKTVNDTEMTKE